MKTKEIHTIIAFALIIGFLFINAKCNKSPFDCANTVYNFELPLKVFPDKDSINIGDTIWLEINESSLIQDGPTGKMVDYSGTSNLGTALSFMEFTGGSFSNPGTEYAVSAFQFNLKSGSEIVHFLPEKVKEFKFEEKQGNYTFKLAVIAKRKGIFAIGISNAANVYREKDKCSKAAFSIPLKETNNHIYLLEQNRPGYIPSGLELTNLYCFKVI